MTLRYTNTAIFQTSSLLTLLWAYLHIKFSFTKKRLRTATGYSVLAIWHIVRNIDDYKDSSWLMSCLCSYLCRWLKFTFYLFFERLCFIIFSVTATACLKGWLTYFFWANEGGKLKTMNSNKKRKIISKEINHSKIFSMVLKMLNVKDVMQCTHQDAATLSFPVDLWLAHHLLPPSFSRLGLSRLKIK